MMMFSNSGARPHKDALALIKKENKYGIVYIKDGKYHTVPKPNDDVLEDVFSNNRPYCLCIDAQKNDRKITGCFNPFIICMSGVDTVLWKNKKMIPVGKFFEHVDTKDVLYSTLSWVARQKPVLPRSTSNDALNMNQRDIVTLFTTDFRVPYAEWNPGQKRWIREYNASPVVPFDYKDIFYVGRNGGWMLLEDKLDIDWSSMPFGVIKNKKIGKIERYIMEFIREEQEIVRRTHGFDYYDMEYYQSEVQAAWVVLYVIKMLKRKMIKVDRDTINAVMKKIASHRAMSLNPAEAMDVYAMQHIDHIVFNIL